ncbi:MAG: hypothetical protein C5B44_01430 [Acidobacteria bacterium]|nr:MAG: hypothetical protein C5B44_01430 [Acidobacteriota bacterium]
MPEDSHTAAKDRAQAKKSLPERMSAADYRAMQEPVARPELKPKAKNKTTIRRHMLGTEIQAALFKLYKTIGVPGSMFYALPLGGLRDLGTARALKREGVKAGPLDTWCRGPGRSSGLWVEFKGRYEPFTTGQEDFMDACDQLGERYAVVRDLDDGIKLLEEENVLLKRSKS